ncbi:MAG TPA: hypothetical protein VE981_16665 [Planctomycetota bacterium]|nr:hypothetical protein [Planctomycetota bacterium]
MRKARLILLSLAAGCATPSQDAERVRVDRQLNELYRPLLALVAESRVSVEDFMKTKLMRDWIFPLKGDEVTLWLEKAEGELMPRNERMCALIREKRDLVDGPELPATFKALLEHQDSWRELHEKWRKDKTPYPWHSRTPFPRRLEPELEEYIKTLEQKKAALAKPG